MFGINFIFKTLDFLNCYLQQAMSFIPIPKLYNLERVVTYYDPTYCLSWPAPKLNKYM